MIFLICCTNIILFSKNWGIDDSVINNIVTALNARFEWFDELFKYDKITSAARIDIRVCRYGIFFSINFLMKFHCYSVAHYASSSCYGASLCSKFLEGYS